MNQNQLMKSANDKIFSGVCAGIAETYNLDVGLVRFLTVLLFLVSGGVVLIVYIVLALVLPTRAEGAVINHAKTKTGIKKKEINEYELDESEYIIDPDDYEYKD